MKSVQRVLGRDLTKVVSATKEDRETRHILRTTSKKSYNILLSLNELIDGQKVEVVSHPSLNIIHRVVYDIDSKNMSNEKLLDKLKAQGVIAVRRITKLRNGVVSNSPLLVISFRGSTLPEYIYLGLARTSRMPYYLSPTLCYRCGKFGHGTRVCPNKDTCLNCSLNHQSDKANPCTDIRTCINCS
ncbi:uncharacterized protein LOC131687210 [Topomyia yanbarensis]|uniref:uncharacterized protein LOC131687210 n=1 Tax=Topomyia yanbarensis TaxID=2498891 RepID=UPI00273B932A|nr:uncharacterized protein LOC131687210 [Topomyia yanbarensis]